MVQGLIKNRSEKRHVMHKPYPKQPGGRGRANGSKRGRANKLPRGRPKPAK